MNVLGYALLAATALSGLTALAALIAPAASRPAVAGVGTCAVGLAGVVAGGAALAGTVWRAGYPGLLPLAGVHLRVDATGGVFIAVAGAVVAAASVYWIGYAGHGHGPGGRAVTTILPLFAWSMLLVPAADSVSTLLVLWELIAVTSLLLVLAEHRRRAAVVAAGWWYAVMTQAGFVAILLGLTWYAALAHGQTFAALRLAHLSPAQRALVFLLILAGFGSKAGLVPAHVWLPRAHPEAPAPVSAMLSAAMVNLGVYGVVRVGLDLLGGGTRWWWLLVMALGALSAFYGILQAAVATELKRLLAYSTVENMGLVFIGVGAAGLLRACGAPEMAALALARRPAPRDQPRGLQDAAVLWRGVGAARHRHPRPGRAGWAAGPDAGHHRAVRARRAGRLRATAGQRVRLRVAAAAVAGARGAGRRGGDRGGDAAGGRGGRADRRGRRRDLRQGTRRRLPGPAAQRRRGRRGRVAALDAGRDGPARRGLYRAGAGTRRCSVRACPARSARPWAYRVRC